MRFGYSAARVGGGSKPKVERSAFVSIIVLVFCGLTSCATISHQFAAPANDWRVRSGQLLYRNAKTTVIGDVVERFSEKGDFELTFSKGPGLPLLVLRQDAQFAEVKGAFARNGWSGSIERAPKQLGGWLGLRDALLHAPNQRTIRHVADGETFLFRF